MLLNNKYNYVYSRKNLLILTNLTRSQSSTILLFFVIKSLFSYDAVQKLHIVHENT